MKREERITSFTQQHKLFGHFVEVGVMTGKFSKNLLKCNPNRLTLIDPWFKYDHQIFGDYLKFTQEKYDQTFVRVSGFFSAYSNVDILRMTSLEGAKRFGDGTLDLVYIDANHKYEFCYDDLNAWWPKIRTGGVLCGHDYQSKGVKKAVTQFVAEQKINPNFEITSEVGCATYFLLKP